MHDFVLSIIDRCFGGRMGHFYSLVGGQSEISLYIRQIWHTSFDQKFCFFIAGFSCSNQYYWYHMSNLSELHKTKWISTYRVVDINLQNHGDHLTDSWRFFNGCRVSGKFVWPGWAIVHVRKTYHASRKTMERVI
jgi:hypothetical protein